MEPQAQIKAVLFDLDGVLLDAVELHYEALNEALKTCGFEPVSREEQETLYNGLPTRTKLKMRGLESGDIERVNTEKQRLTGALLRKTVLPDPRLVAVLQAVRDHGYRMGCCSNSVRSTVDSALLCLGALPFMQFSLSNEDVANPKPHPEIYSKACEMLGLKPWEVLAVEDNVNGQRAVLEAGCRLCVVRDPLDVTIDRILGSIVEHENLGYLVPPPEPRKPRTRT